MVGNKYDLFKDGEKEYEELEKEAKEYAEKNNMIFQYTSALKATGIDLLFNEIGDKIVKLRENDSNKDCFELKGNDKIEKNEDSKNYNNNKIEDDNKNDKDSKDKDKTGENIKLNDEENKEKVGKKKCC